jgi:eukaryotic-like serine/threonine-protein kinase
MIEVGQTIGNYRITAKLGEGGMGIVYLAEHPVIGRKVALKAIHPELSRNPEVVSRFMTEAKSVNQIGNEHIVDVSDFGNTTDGEFYFIMEFLQGEAVADRLRRERLFEAPRALQIAAQVADALSSSHSHGIIHRDLKPENIFLINRGQTRDFVKVLDFGLAKLIQGEEKVSHKTRTGSVMGTPYYMSPEQCEGKAGVDYRADIYSLGVILFEMMTGRVPFGGEGYGEIIVKHLTVPAPLPSSFNPAITPAQEAVVMHALAKSREDRFRTMDEFRAAMLDPERFLASGAHAGPTVAPLPAADQSPSRTTLVGAGAAAGTDESNPSRVRVPTTFRSGAGELYDEGDQPVRSRKPGLVVGALLAAAAAAVAAVLYVKARPPAGTADPGAAAAVAEPVIPVATTPPAATEVKLTFTSDPDSARVLMKETGQTLGTTPFEKAFPTGQDQVTFVFKKDGFEDREVSLAPTTSAPVRAALPPVVVPSPAAVNSAPKAREIRPAATGRPTRKSPRPRKTARPTDEDGVLEPSFR